MKITFLGTCSGTEPVSGFRHVSFAVEHGDGAFLFDAGEGCSYTAHLLGINLLRTKAVFISHCHMDHIGGLCNFLWNINKIDRMAGGAPTPVKGGTIRVFIPNLNSWEGVMRILRGTEGGFSCRFSLEAETPAEGKIYSENGFQVCSCHNNHLARSDAGWLSCSYRIEADGKALVYSGDVREPSDLAPILDGADMLLMETGHHRISDICNYLNTSGMRVKTLGFIHHGRPVLADPEKELATAKKLFGPECFIASDGMTMEL